jgi:hypothetical protein
VTFTLATVSLTRGFRVGQGDDPFAASSVCLLLRALEVVLARRIADRAELELESADSH